MNIAELKLAAIAEISRLNDENAVREILEHLASFVKDEKKDFDVKSFFNRVANKHDEVLEKLSQ